MLLTVYLSGFERSTYAYLPPYLFVLVITAAHLFNICVFFNMKGRVNITDGNIEYIFYLNMILKLFILFIK